MAAASTNLLLPVLLLLIATLSPTPATCYLHPGGRSTRQDDATETSAARRSYIVFVDEPPRASADEVDVHRRWHESFLPSDDSSEEQRGLLHSYTEVFSGFAARLTDAELAAVAEKPGFLRALPDRRLQLMTTHTPAFLGLRNGTGLWSDKAAGGGYGRGVIVGLLDTGIHAAHPSFDDRGVPPPPARWKGSCVGSASSRCNKKLIGAKSFVGGDSGDEEGHGTHTSSTAAGNFVAGASVQGLGAGTAAGIAPGAHVAMYKVCSGPGCDLSAILAGMDAAIKDGVDVLSISLGSDKSTGFELDPIAIGAFSAVSKGIVVVCAGGNSGPINETVTNEAPWLLTVAAGSMDRSFQARVNLGNGKLIHGEALQQVASKPSSKRYPLLYSADRRDCNYTAAAGAVVAGKIVVCEAWVYPQQAPLIRNVTGLGAAGVVLINTEGEGYTTALRSYYNSSVVQVTAADGEAIVDYATSLRRNSVPTATFTYDNTLLGIRPAPVVASFSSRGPSIIAPGILKPDILAPGLNILAAWPPKGTAGTTGPFKIISGTSMATPHVSGVAALIKSFHPDWSPAAIKSAIMTTSDAVDITGGSILDETHGRAGAYAAGAGHVNPARAADPGLVYDISVHDYIGYICWSSGEAGLVYIVRDPKLTFCAKVPKIDEVQLNYPTIAVPVNSTAPFTVNRTVTNVGPARSTYTAKVEAPRSMTVRVSPETLVFSKAGERKTFSVSVSVASKDVVPVEGSLSWVSAKHIVRSPVIAITREDPL